MFVIGPQSQLDQGTSIRRGFRLPIVIRLKTLHCPLGRVIPDSRWFPVEIVLADQSFLNFQGALRINPLLSAGVSISSRFARLFALAHSRVRR